MTWLIDFITERPVMFARYVCYIAVAVAAVVGIIIKKKKSKNGKGETTMEISLELKNSLLENKWLEYCGTSKNCNYSFDYVLIDNAKKAVKGVTSRDWENLCLEKIGDFTAYLSKEHKKEYKDYYNKTVLEIKQTFFPLLAEKITSALTEKQLSEKVWDDIRFNLIAILMIDFYSYDFQTEFLNHLLEVYLSGHLPCGMEDGNLIIY